MVLPSQSGAKICREIPAHRTRRLLRVIGLPELSRRDAAAADLVLVVAGDVVPGEGLLATVAEFGTATVLLDGAEQWAGIALLAGSQLPGEDADAAFLRLAGSGTARGVLLAELDDIYSVETRRPVAPWVVRVRDRASAREAKRRILERSQKRTLDPLASFLHRPIEFPAGLSAGGNAGYR